MLSVGQPSRGGNKTGSSGTGSIDYRSGKGQLLLSLVGGGYTQALSVDPNLYLRSYNNPSESARGLWQELSTSGFNRLLTWPTQGTIDPTFLFVSPKLMSSLRSKVVAARATGKQADKAYQLWLDSFAGPEFSPTAPTLTCWIDGENRLAKIQLVWPIESSKEGVGQSSTSSSNEIATIRVDLSLLNFGTRVDVQRPAPDKIASNNSGDNSFTGSGSGSPSP